jgi:hypothetical protein
MRDNMLPIPQVHEPSPHLPTEHTTEKKVIDGLDTLRAEGAGGVAGQAMPLATLGCLAAVLQGQPEEEFELC